MFPRIIPGDGLNMHMYPYIQLLPKSERSQCVVIYHCIFPALIHPFISVSGTKCQFYHCLWCDSEMGRHMPAGIIKTSASGINAPVSLLLSGLYGPPQIILSAISVVRLYYLTISGALLFDNCLFQECQSQSQVYDGFIYESQWIPLQILVISVHIQIYQNTSLLWSFLSFHAR